MWLLMSSGCSPPPMCALAAPRVRFVTGDESFQTIRWDPTPAGVAVEVLDDAASIYPSPPGSETVMRSGFPDGVVRLRARMDVPGGDTCFSPVTTLTLRPPDSADAVPASSRASTTATWDAAGQHVTLDWDAPPGREVRVVRTADRSGEPVDLGWLPVDVRTFVDAPPAVPAVGDDPWGVAPKPARCDGEDAAPWLRYTFLSRDAARSAGSEDVWASPSGIDVCAPNDSAKVTVRDARFVGPVLTVDWSFSEDHPANFGDADARVELRDRAGVWSGRSGWLGRDTLGWTGPWAGATAVRVTSRTGPGVLASTPEITTPTAAPAAPPWLAGATFAGPAAYAWDHERDAVQLEWALDYPAHLAVRVQRRGASGWRDVTGWLDDRTHRWIDEDGDPTRVVGYRLVARTTRGVLGPPGEVLEVSGPRGDRGTVYLPPPTGDRRKPGAGRDGR